MRMIRNQKPVNSHSRGRTALRCNICDGRYRASSPHQRFCKTCREESELFRFADWLAV